MSSWCLSMCILLACKLLMLLPLPIHPCLSPSQSPLPLHVSTLSIILVSFYLLGHITAFSSLFLGQLFPFYQFYFFIYYFKTFLNFFSEIVLKTLIFSKHHLSVYMFSHLFDHKIPWKIQKFYFIFLKFLVTDHFQIRFIEFYFSTLSYIF